MTKPILFNTGMVRAILEGRKTVTRRAVKRFVPDDAQFGYTAFTPKGCISARGIYEDGYGEKFYKLPYQPGDIVWVRETWRKNDMKLPWEPTGDYIYRADVHPLDDSEKWHPSIHMPKELARIFLRVAGVRVERLQNTDDDDIRCEGFANPGDFIRVWDSTIKPADRDKYGWAASPWVWVIEFQRCEKPEGF